MKTFFLSRIESIWGIQKEFRLKVFFLTSSFFLLTVCQSIWRPLKTSVFISIVGVKSIPDAKFFLVFPVIFFIIIYSKLVDWLRRHQVFYWFTISCGIGGFVCYYFLSHPVYGLANTQQGTSRIFGWFFYFFMEIFGAFMSAVFWSFANSINKPNDAKNYYGLLVGGSKVGGILGAGTLYYLTTFSGIQDQTLLPNCMLVGSVALLGAAGSIYLLMKHVPGYYMHGYEAAYQIEKKREQNGDILKSIRKAFDGLFIIIKNPYVFGIFSIILCYEVVIVIFDYLVALAAHTKHSSAGGLTSYYAVYMLWMHSIGLLIAIFGTSPIQRFLGIRISLFASPIFSALLLIIVLIYPSPEMVFASLVILRALNYAINHPTRETLFIPTTKAIKFKAKAWTDAFGSRSSKAIGSLFNKFALQGLVRTSAAFSIFITIGWISITYFLGKTCQETIDNNKVIGDQENQIS